MLMMKGIDPGGEVISLCIPPPLPVDSCLVTSRALYSLYNLF